MKHRHSWRKRIITLQLLLGFAACTLILSGIASAFSVTFDTAWESRFQRTSGWTDAASLAQCNGCFAYAAKAHRFLSGPNDLLISFVVNSTHFDMLRTDTDIYRPRFIRLSIEGVIP